MKAEDLADNVYSTRADEQWKPDPQKAEPNYQELYELECISAKKMMQEIQRLTEENANLRTQRDRLEIWANDNKIQARRLIRDLVQCLTE